MFQAQSIFAILLLAVVAVSAISKKSDDNGPMPSQPVYQGGSGNNGQYSMPGQYGQSHEHQAQNSGSQSNLYYYYYPVQDKPKDGPYHQANNAPMNHQQPSPSSSSSSSSHDNVEHGGQMDAQASGSEISYSSPAELSHDYPSQSQGFDAQTLSNLASQFQQQYFNNPSQSYDNAAAAAAGLGYVPQAEASGHIASQVHPGYNGPLGPQSHLAFAQGAPYGGQNVFGFGGGGAGAGGAIQPQSSEVGSSLASGLKKYGLSSILMPVLAIAGLSLLLPTVTSLGTTTTKTKRSIEDSPFSSYIEKMDAYYKMYNKALEKEECMNRMICELGDAVSDVRGRSALLMVVENLAPQWMEKKMSVFKNGALSKDTSKCKKYSC